MWITFSSMIMQIKGILMLCKVYNVNVLPWVGGVQQMPGFQSCITVDSVSRKTHYIHIEKGPPQKILFKYKSY